MPDRHLRERAAQLIVKESRYRFPPWLRFGLIGFALGLAFAALIFHQRPASELIPPITSPPIRQPIRAH